eukprot:174723-Chlamydomonas_euryale.AAC.2
MESLDTRPLASPHFARVLVMPPRPGSDTQHADNVPSVRCWSRVGRSSPAARRRSTGHPAGFNHSLYYLEA